MEKNHTVSEGLAGVQPPPALPTALPGALPPPPVQAGGCGAQLGGSRRGTCRSL